VGAVAVLLAEGDNQQPQVQKGRAVLEPASSGACPAGNSQSTFARMLKLAETGNPEAQYHVGMFFNNGLGVERDPAKAFGWFEKAAGGDPLGAYKLGCYFDGQGDGVVARDVNKALHYTLIAANAGYSLAQHAVANTYGMQGNFDDAARWWQKAADQGYPVALYNLSNSYMTGHGTPKDIAMSYAYFKLSKLVTEKSINPQAQASLTEMAGRMSAADLARAEELVAAWHPQPTALTLKATKGQAAAIELLEAMGY
jgi:TPR repeat protein